MLRGKLKTLSSNNSQLKRQQKSTGNIVGLQNYVKYSETSI